MARKFGRKRQITALTEINMTPLIDLAFALLIIFMVTTPLLEQSIDINLPSESQKEQPNKDIGEVQMIVIDKTGKVFWGDLEVEHTDLRALVGGLNTEDVVEVRGDADVRYQSIVTVMDVLKEHKIRKISLATQSG